MIKIAVYGKGGIGKSTTVSNLAVALVRKGYRVMQIGCDPKADSTSLLNGGRRIKTVLDLVREKGDKFELEDMVTVSEDGVFCVEAGGPIPGLGCAGRGIIAALERLEKKGAYEKYKPDIVLYDVLGDVVCGGFSMPMHKGYAQKVFIVTSGEKMACYAAGNIAMAIDNFKGRGYAQLGGLILNRRNVEDELENVQTLAKDFNTVIVGDLERSKLVQECDRLGTTVMNKYPDSDMAKQYMALADEIMKGFEADA